MTSFAADRSRRTTDTDRWLAGLLGAEPGVALVAVGGYGRKELLPGSDLDVLLLHDGRDGIARIADRIWYPVWDSGAHLDHAVRTVPQARRVARSDLKVALGLLYARHVAGDPELTTRLREGALEDWRANARTRLAELKALHEERTRLHGELAFLLEPDLKESRGGQRDVHAIQAIAAAWVAPAPGPKVRAAYDQITDARHVLHDVTGRPLDRLVLEEQDEVARTLGLLDGDALLRQLAGAGRTVAYGVDHAFRMADRAGGRRALGMRMRRGRPERRPLADGVVEQEGEVVLARAASPATDPVLVLRAAAAAAQSGLPLAPRALARLAECPPLPVPWPDQARNELLALLGAGPNAIAVWEALDQEGLLAALIPDWDRVRNARSATRCTGSPWTGTLSSARRTPPPTPATCHGPTCCCSPRCCTTSARAGPATTASPARWWRATCASVSASATPTRSWSRLRCATTCCCPRSRRGATWTTR